MNVVVKRTTIGNVKKVILEECCYEFCEDLWRLIKEFAGIYSFAIPWDKLVMRTYPRFFKTFIRFASLPSGSIGDIPDNRFKKLPEKEIRKIFWTKVNKGDFKEQMWFSDVKKVDKKILLEKIASNWGVWTLPLEYKVGDEIQFYRLDYADDKENRAGKIISIGKNRTSYKILEYTTVAVSSRHSNYDRIITYGWDKTTVKTSIIKSDKRIKKGLSNWEYTVYYN